MIPSGVSICGRYRWREAAFHIEGVFYFDTILFSFAYAVSPCSSARSIRKTGRGIVCCPSSRYLSLVAVVDGVADGNGVPVDGV